MLVKTTWQKSAKSCSESIKMAFPEHPVAEKSILSSTDQVSPNTIKNWLQHYTLQSTLLQVDTLLTLETWVCLPSHVWLYSAEMVKNLSAVQETGFNPWVEKIPWRRAWQPTPIFLPGEFPWTEEPDGLQSTGSQRVGYNWATKHSTAKISIWHSLCD